MNRFIALFLAAGSLVAQEVPVALTKATSTFLSAVASDDVGKLATVSHFPIKSNEFRPIVSRVELQKAFPIIFTKERKAGLVRQTPVLRSNGVYSLSSQEQNDPIQFLFKKFGNEFRFYLIDNINE